MPEPVTKTVELKRLGRAAEVRAQTVDEEARTVELVWSTGAGVERRIPGIGRVLEVLEMDERNIRLDRLRNGAPLLNTHWDFDLSDVLGVVEEAWVEDGAGMARVRFSGREQVDGVWRDVAAGIIRNISVGYRVHAMEIEERDGEIPIMRVTDWEPLELSAVPVPADPGAGFRAEDDQAYPCTLKRAPTPDQSKEDDMSDEENGVETRDAKPDAKQDKPASAPEQVIVDERKARDAAEDAVKAERARAAEIRKIGSRLADKFEGFDKALIDQAIDDGRTVEQARAAFLDALAEADSGATVNSRVSVGRDERETKRRLMADALSARVRNKDPEDDAAREFRGMTLVDMARECVDIRGERTRGKTRSEIVREALSRGYHSTSDFPLILANVMNKTLRAAYEAAPQTFRPIVRERTASDFKPITNVRLDGSISLVAKPEGAEYKFATIGEHSEVYSLATYGRAISFTREMIINDDLAAFDRITGKFGQAAADFESDTVWALLTSNPTMGDSTALFHADHGNLASAGAITIDNLGKARTLMRNQTDGDTRLNIEPAFLAVPAELETVARQYMTASIVPETSANANVYANSMGVIIEPRLAETTVGGSADDWYLIANPSRIDTIEIAYLEGEAGVQTEQTEDWNTDGVKLKARLVFAAKAMDWRGFVKNPGS